MSLARNLSKLAQFLNGSGLLTSLGLAPDAVQVGMKNRIINGAFQIAQRSTGGSSTPSAGVTSYTTLDRWFIAQTGTTASLFQGQTTPQTTGVYKAGYFGRNSGQTNVPSNIFMGQQIESFNVYDLRGQSAIISFNAFRGANAPTSLKCVVRFGTAADQSSSNGLNGSWTGYSASTASDFTVDTTVGTFTKTVSVPSDASEMMVLFYYAPTGTAGANEWFAFENVQLEKNSTATSFDYRPYGTELALCQRYFNTVKAINGTSGGTNNGMFSNVGYAEMRTTPTFAVTGALVITDPGNAVYTQSSGNVSVAGGQSSSGAFLAFGNFSGLPFNRSLMLNTNTTYLTLNAEL